MKFAVVFALCIAAVIAAPPHLGEESQAQVLRSDLDNIGVEGYKFA